MGQAHEGGGHSFRRLRVWQEAKGLANDVFRAVRGLPWDHGRVAEQMRGAARSVHANIAEGSGAATPRDFLRFLGYSLKSLRELQSDVITLQDSRALPTTVGRSLSARIGNVERLLLPFMRRIAEDS
jgi:four helix bundle protein